MSALIKIFPSTSRSPRYLSFVPSEETEFRPSRNLMGLEVFRQDTLRDKESFSISLGTLSIEAYHGLIGVNPHLIPFISNLTIATIWNPHTTAQLWISFRANRTINLASIGPLLTVNLVD